MGKAVADEPVVEPKSPPEKPKTTEEKLEILRSQRTQLEGQLNQTLGYIQALEDIIKENGK